MKALFISLAFLLTSAHANKRPFYIIGHQVNSIAEVKEFLDMGSNVLESDIQFFPNGSVKEMLHGLPCECNRDCLLKAKLSDYMQYIRDITNPEKPNSYHEKMLVHFLDLKLTTSKDKKLSGRDIARHVLDYLWSQDGKRKQEVRVLVYFDQADESDVVLGFMDEFKDRGKEDRLRDVGFDGGSGNISTIRKTFSELGITRNIWLGDGSINCHNKFYPYDRLIEALSNPGSEVAFIDKVYAWTIDLEQRMRDSLKLGVDGMITNVPDRLLKIIQEPDFEKDFRLGNINDDPFAYYDGN